MPGSFREGEIKGVVVCKLTKALDSRGWLASSFATTVYPKSFSGNGLHLLDQSRHRAWAS